MAHAEKVGTRVTASFRRALVAGVLTLAVGGTVLAQRGGNFRGNFRFEQDTPRENVPYDGRFVFVRMSYTGAMFGRGGAAWAHDYPLGEANFLSILTAVSNVPANLEGTNVLAFDDPDIFKFPVIYLVEPGYWQMDDEQVTNLRDYLLKGGFLIVDDFPYWGWDQFEAQMGRAFPGLEWQEIDVTQPIFHSFFDIATLDIVPAYPALGERPIFRALFEDNDSSKRMYAVANYQNDLSEYWEYSRDGFYAVDETNEAYKVGVNQFLYGMTH
jgi:hypothetical protein